MSMKYWRSDTKRGRQNYSATNLSHCHCH